MHTASPAVSAVRLFGLAFALCACGVSAQGYPVKPVRIVLPFAPGGVADITTRTFAQKMSEPLGQQVLVENRPSAGGIVAAEAVAKAAPDGYTLLLMSNGTAVSASLFKSLPYDPVRDFSPISTMGYFDMLLVVGPGAPYGTLKELVSAAKAAPNRIAVGTITPGGTQHLAMELFRSMAGIELNAITYKTTPEVLTALRAGDIQAAFEFVAPLTGPMKAGTVKVLGITSAQRFPGLKDIPTIAEAGVPGYVASSWNGLAAPAKTPRAVIDRVNKEVAAAVVAPEVREKLLQLGVDTRASSPEELAKLLAADIAKWAAVIEKAKIEKQ
jgi:tripartite-type tricarboxylate transporter receptor subunit TctC